MHATQATKTKRCFNQLQTKNKSKIRDLGNKDKIEEHNRKKLGLDRLTVGRSRKRGKSEEIKKEYRKDGERQTKKITPQGEKRRRNHKREKRIQTKGRAGQRQEQGRGRGRGRGRSTS